MKQDPCILRVYLGYLLPNLIIDQQFNESSTGILQFQTLTHPFILGDHSIYFLCRHLQSLIFTQSGLSVAKAFLATNCVLYLSVSLMYA